IWAISASRFPSKKNMACKYTASFSAIHGRSKKGAVIPQMKNSWTLRLKRAACAALRPGGLRHLAKGSVQELSGNFVRSNGRRGVKFIIHQLLGGLRNFDVAGLRAVEDEIVTEGAKRIVKLDDPTRGGRVLD